MVNSSSWLKCDRGYSLAVNQVEQERQRRWRRYFIIGIGVLLSVLLVAAIVYFWDTIQHAESYGLLGGFLISILGGITIIPAPSLIVVFTLGHVLNPLYLGLVSGFGEALGGITVYLTGAGGETLWSKLRARRQTFYYQPSSSSNSPTLAQSKLRSKWQAFYQRLASSLVRPGGLWTVFIVTAFVWILCYPVGLAAGSTHMGLKRFFLVSWAGKTIRGLIVAYAGHWGLYYLLQWIGG